MTTLENLLAHEKALQDAWCTVLAPDGYAAFPEFSDKEKAATPLYEVRLQGVAETGKCLPGNKLQPCQWKGILVTRPVTQRFKNSDKQSDMITRVRVARFQFIERFNAALTHHTVTWMKEINTVPSHIAAQQLDVTEIHHEIIWEVRVQSWPQDN